eukprot:Skav211186  [mRNA]  locus=scaffold884:208707:209336:+ [translate_table: standard]
MAKSGGLAMAILAVAAWHSLTFLASSPRRLVLGGLLSSVVAPEAAHAGLALKSFTSGGFKEYSVAGAFKISMPDNYKVLEQEAMKTVWQGDRQGDLNTMVAQAKVVEEDTLDKALGLSGKSLADIGEELSNRRPFGGSDFMGVEKLEGVDAYRFEFVNDKIHEYMLYSLVNQGSQKLLCTVLTRAPGLLWQNGNRYQTLAKIIESFKLI